MPWPGLIMCFVSHMLEFHENKKKSKGKRYKRLLLLPLLPFGIGINVKGGICVLQAWHALIAFAGFLSARPERKRKVEFRTKTTPSRFAAHLTLNRNPNCFPFLAQVFSRETWMGKKKAHVSLASANSRPFCTKCSVITFHAHDDRSAINQRVDEREAVMENMCSFPINYAAAATGRLRALLYRTKCARARATTGHQKSINIQDVPARRKRKVKEKNFHLLHVAQL